MPELGLTVDEERCAPLASLPAVGRVMEHARVRHAAAGLARPVLLRLVRALVDAERGRLAAGGEAAGFESFCRAVVLAVERLVTPSLRSVINATGIVLHTNLGRAPLSKAAAQQVARLARGYTNLEIDLDTGKRGSRQTHLQTVLRFLTGAEDVLVVNNNAAAILLVSRALAWRSEIVISRGELVEIGESFRLADIMKAGGARLAEVGATNRTCLDDYQNAIGPRTALLFKAHTSNFKTIGFTEQVSVAALADCAHAHRLPCVYDLGSGMLRRPPALPAAEEPSAEEAIAAGADLVTFSGDKLLGAGQAGIIAGRKSLIAKLGKSPILRALRPSRLALAALQGVALAHLDDQRWLGDNPVCRMLERAPDDLRAEAERLAAMLELGGVVADVIPSVGQAGGGTLPGLPLPGWAVRVLRTADAAPFASKMSARLFLALLHGTPPVLAVLREGRVLLDPRTVEPEDMDLVAHAVRDAVDRCRQP